MSDEHEVKGSIVREYALKTSFKMTQYDSIYATFSFYKSGNSVKYQRSFEKIDSVLSYIGGLLGTITICLFIVYNYNSSSF